jgi:5-methylcytosine-specific restriction endonuclease McrA
MKYQINKEMLDEVAKTSISVAEILKKLNIPLGGGNYKLINKLIDLYDIDISHFMGKSWSKNKILTSKIKLDDILNNKINFSRTQLKKRLLNSGLLEYKCDSCGNTGEWMGKPISLELDHINGINNDNRLENLRILCPNCHSQTDTFRKKNKIEILNKPKIDNPIREPNICDCGKIITNNSKTCKQCYRLKSRKVKRPQKDILLKEIEEFGYSKVGKKYGVSDNAVRKWLKYFDI